MLALAVTAFWLIFVAELGDKTLLLVLLLSARLSPLRVFAGAALAFLVHGLLAVALGQLLGLLPHAWVRYGSAGLFLFFGLGLLLRKPEGAIDAGLRPGRGPLLTSFVFIFLAEWGDMTQILSAALVADHTASLGRLGAAIAVFCGAVLGLWAGTALAVAVGRKAGRWLPAHVLQRAAGACFLAVAGYTAFVQR